MPPPPYTPQNKRFMRDYITSIGGVEAFSSRHKIALRTAQRIYAGSYAPQPSLINECLAAIGAPDLQIDESDVPY
jgi:hypothetical protein